MNSNLFDFFISVSENIILALIYRYIISLHLPFFQIHTLAVIYVLYRVQLLSVLSIRNKYTQKISLYVRIAAWSTKATGR